MGSLLEVRNLTIRYGAGRSAMHQAVDRVSFDIAHGEVVGLMGESGCGKSSIALAVLGLLPEESTEVSGSVLFRGEELLGIDERRLQKVRGQGISLVYQEPSIALSPVMRVGDQIAEILHAHRNWSWKECRMQAEEELARVGLAPTGRISRAYVHQLSGGQRQRVVLAQALCCEPALLIADEPTASLDARTQADFLALLRELKKQSSISILLISHSPEVQASLAERLMVMKDGEIIEQGTFEKLYRNPVHDCTRLMLRRATRRSTTAHLEPERELEVQRA